MRAINQARAEGATDAELKPMQDKLRELTSVLGLTLEKTTESDQAVDGFISLIIETRKDLRSHKLWDLADKLRDRLLALGVVLEDSKDGTSWHWK